MMPPFPPVTPASILRNALQVLQAILALHRGESVYIRRRWVEQATEIVAGALLLVEREERRRN